MSTHVVFNGVDDVLKSRLEAYWAKKLPRLQKVLVPYPEDQQEIRLTVSYHQQSSIRAWYETRGVIHLPTGTLAAEATDKVPEVTIDRVADLLVNEIKKHKELVRKDYVFKRKRRAKEGLRATEHMLDRDVEARRREEFMRLLRPQLRFISNYARRELRILEKSGLLHRREATVADLIDEVLTLAWERWKDRPRHLSVDLWLTDLVHETLEQWIKQEPRPHVSLQEKSEDTMPGRVHVHEDEQEWWAELLGEEETLRLEDLLPAPEGTEEWDEQAVRHQRNRLLSVLGELPAAQRQAFLLHVLEDYDSAEIAQLQNRSEAEVKADIENARETLRKRLLAGGDGQQTGKSAQQQVASH